MRISDWSSDVCSSDLGNKGQTHTSERLHRRASHDAPEVFGKFRSRHTGHASELVDTPVVQRRIEKCSNGDPDTPAPHHSNLGTATARALDHGRTRPIDEDDFCDPANDASLTVFMTGIHDFIFQKFYIIKTAC